MTGVISSCSSGLNAMGNGYHQREVKKSITFKAGSRRNLAESHQPSNS